jgi:hypothetical protein
MSSHLRSRRIESGNDGGGMTESAREARREGPGARLGLARSTGVS